MIQDKLTKRLSFLLGKNGCGKSTLLRDLEQNLSHTPDWFVKYITPERGGSLIYNANIEQNILNNVSWLKDSRRTNRFEQFREQSVSQFRNLELFVLREIEQNADIRKNQGYTFDSVVAQINELLPLVSVKRSSGGFEIQNKADNARIEAQRISSGESESIALAIEALVFSRECQARPKRLLLIDEPDVHLHPDLQIRYIRFLDQLAKEKNFKVLVATHSTAIVGSIQDKTECQLAFMPLKREAEIEFSPINEIATSVLPIFGAHPLSNVFNECPVMLVEGDDDRRIWDQAVRTAQGKVSVFPCPTGSIDKITEWETWLVQKLPSLYDEPKAFSLRDRDNENGELDDRLPVIRFRLACRTAENMMLADEALTIAGIHWDSVVEGCKKWLSVYGGHPQYAAMKAFADGGFDRFNADLKDIRNILLAILGVSKPWEVLVGQAIASVALGQGQNTVHALSKYLGKKASAQLLRI